MRQAKLVSGIAAVLLVMGSSPGLANTEIYRWVGEDGVVHFSEQPPANIEAEKVDTRVDESQGVDFDAASSSTTEAGESGADAEPVDMAAKLREERAEARRQAAAERAETEASCKRANEVVAQLEPFPRVMTENAEGEMVRMDDNVRLEKLGEAKDYIAANCSK